MEFLNFVYRVLFFFCTIMLILVTSGLDVDGSTPESIRAVAAVVALLSVIGSLGFVNWD